MTDYPHITDLLDLTPALDAALLGMTAQELKDHGHPDPEAKAAKLWEATSPVERRESRALIMAAVYPAARAIAEQAYERALDSARDGTPLECEVNPFAEGQVVT